MGREIVKKQSLEEPGKRQFLWDANEIFDGTGNVLGISLFTSWGEEIHISKSAFDGMNSLQFLKPSKFSGKFLVELIMQHSNFEKLWEGIQPLQCLNLMDLSYSKYLKEIPDLSRATSLEELYLSDCETLLSETRIEEVPPWVEKLFRLQKLIMNECARLKNISPNISKLENLELLCLCTGCFSMSDSSRVHHKSVNEGCRGINIEANNENASGEDEEKEDDVEEDEGADDEADEDVDSEDDVKDNDTAFSDEGMDINIEAENETEEGEGAESALDEYAETSSRKRMRKIIGLGTELNSTRNVLGVAGLKCFIWNKDYSLWKTKLLHQESLSMSKHRQMSRDKTRTIRLALCNPQD
ncbi:hypothetical protein F2Q70_00014486 [Brassica cretica]|uniref:Uncharacterized protein n=1 Tax=Brassica cretica TaxID=69181 RepID=A0A8S9I4A7_BRACR|nr:hypothetical protein F2Q70_00014486 [Brassica cretica]